MMRPYDGAKPPKKIDLYVILSREMTRQQVIDKMTNLVRKREDCQLQIDERTEDLGEIVDRFKQLHNGMLTRNGIDRKKGEYVLMQFEASRLEGEKKTWQDLLDYYQQKLRNYHVKATQALNVIEEAPAE
jgi:ATP-dependent Zn protease